MTSKVYKTAQGKTVDLGTIMLQNEHTRAVGNMNVNARGDRLDSNNKVIETKNRQIHRQNTRTTVPAEVPVHTSTNKAKQAKKDIDLGSTVESISLQDALDPEVIQDVPTNPEVVVATPLAQEVSTAGGGLAAAIARSKIIKQEKEKSTRQIAQSTPGVKRI